jgi:RND family efflux transporter MFP subunit
LIFYFKLGVDFELVKPRKTILIAGVIAIILALVIGQRVYSNISSSNERAQRASGGQEIAVDLAKVERRNITPVLSYSANIEPAWSANISPKIDGRIKNLYVNEGDVVETGAVIATLDTDELLAQVVQAEGALYKAQADMAQAEYTLRRNEQLFKIGAVSAQDDDNSKTNYNVAKGQLISAQGNLTHIKARLGNADIISPQGGVVTKRHLQAGYFAKIGESIVTIADVENLLAKATVGEAQIAQINVGDEVKITVNALGDQIFSGKVTRISPAAQMPSRTFTAEVSILDGLGILRAGMSAHVLAAGREKENVIAIPETALVMREDMKTAYVVVDENKVQQKILKVGFVGGGWAEILEGIAEGDLVVTSGQNKLRDGAVIKMDGAGDEQ